MDQSLTLHVVSASADLTTTLARSPVAVHVMVGTPLTYTATVTNNGPTGIVMEQGKPNGHDEVVSPFKRVLLRTMPELKDELSGVVNAFDPWARDRGGYYSVAWKPRAGAESDTAFRKP